MARGDGRLTHDLLPGEKAPQDACGVFGVWAPGEEVAKLCYFGLYALQHRGQESAGIATGDGSKVLVYKDMGLVSQVFDEASLQSLRGHVAIGHCRYSTTGGSTWENAQPTLGGTDTTTVALAHNGNLINSAELRELVDHRHGVGHRTALGPGPFARGSRPRRPAPAARRLLFRLHGRAHPVCRPRPARHPPAGAGPARPRLGRRLGDRGAADRRRGGDPRDRAGGAARHRRERAALAPLRPPGAEGLRLRVRLPRPPRRGHQLAGGA